MKDFSLALGMTKDIGIIEDIEITNSVILSEAKDL